MPGSQRSPLELELATAQHGLSSIQLTGLIGRGDWGSVYSGTGPTGEVAVRRVDQTLAHDDAVLARFVASVRAAAQLDHPHILPIIELVECGSFALIVMPRCPTNLHEIDRPISVVDACTAGVSLLFGLQAAHDKGVFHGDLRPRNSLIDSQSRVVISDVGLAAPLQTSTRTATTLHPSAWTHRSPEQIMGGATGPYSDCYAVASIVYLLLTNTTPYAVPRNFAELLARAASGAAAAPLAQIAPHVPVPIAALIDTGLRATPAERPASAKAFAADLAAAASYVLGDGWERGSRFRLGQPLPDPERSHSRWPLMRRN
jgi:serine/threonine-protein kinase